MEERICKKKEESMDHLARGCEEEEIEMSVRDLVHEDGRELRRGS